MGPAAGRRSLHGDRLRYLSLADACDLYAQRQLGWLSAGGMQRELKGPAFHFPLAPYSAAERHGHIHGNIYIIKKGMVIYMEISTSLNIYNNFVESYEEAIKRAYDCGFLCFDFNPIDYLSGDNFYTSDNWRENIANIREYAESMGAKFMQAHAFCFNGAAPADMDYQMRKTIEAAALVGAPWTVMHPWVVHKSTDFEIQKENVRLFEPYVEYAKELGVGIAIENMFKKVYWFGEEVNSEAFSTADELIEIIDPLNEEYGNVGACWDTGHANLSMKSQYDDLLKLGKRLKVLHIADNYGQGDDHMPAFYGCVDWKEIMRALKKIKYNGTFNFETQCFTKNLPNELVDDALRFMYKIGAYAVNLSD